MTGVNAPSSVQRWKSSFVLGARHPTSKAGDVMRDEGLARQAEVEHRRDDRRQPIELTPVGLLIAHPMDLGRTLNAW